MLKFLMYSTWGDQNYLGLNGIELYDQHGKPLKVHPSFCVAYPSSINELPNSSGKDVRTIDKVMHSIVRGGLLLNSFLLSIPLVWVSSQSKQLQYHTNVTFVSPLLNT